MPNKKRETIKINSELYDSLREWCDRENIRLIDFVEESLQSAVDDYEQLKLAEENKKVASQLKENYDKIYKKGFDEGFFIALYNLKGKAWAGSEKDTLKKNVEKNILKPVEGPQLKLF